MRSFSAAAAMLCLIIGCGITEPVSAPEPEPPRPPEELIEEMIAYRGCYGAEADGRIRLLLAELREQDSAQGELWTKIMDYWQYADTEMELHIDRLPDGLPDDDSLALTVLGYSLNPDGTMKDELTARLTAALHCAEQYPNAYVICTGGGTAMLRQDVTEGGLMGEWMLAHGIPESRLIIEDRSLSTAANACNTYEILRSSYPQVDSVVLISSDYHIAWGALMFETAFLRSAYENRTPEIHVISNCACVVEDTTFPRDDLLHWEAGGMFELIGNSALASQYYHDFANVVKPPLS